MIGRSRKWWSINVHSMWYIQSKSYRNFVYFHSEFINKKKFSRRNNTKIAIIQPTQCNISNANTSAKIIFNWRISDFVTPTIHTDIQNWTFRVCNNEKSFINPRNEKINKNVMFVNLKWAFNFWNVQISNFCKNVQASDEIEKISSKNRSYN